MPYVMWKSVAGPDDDTIQRKRIAWRISKATDTQAEYLIFFTLTRQQRLRERVSMLRLYVRCLFCLFVHYFYLLVEF
jgi:hypothetical protein